jgi:hypothetical protein
MSRRKKDPPRVLTAEELQELARLARSQVAPAAEVIRARILLAGFAPEVLNKRYIRVTMPTSESNADRLWVAGVRRRIRSRRTCKRVRSCALQRSGRPRMSGGFPATAPGSHPSRSRGHGHVEARSAYWGDRPGGAGLPCASPPSPRATD